MNEKFCILIKISQIFFPKGPIDNKHSIGLDNGLAPGIGDKPLSEPMLIRFTDAYMWHLREMG